MILVSQAGVIPVAEPSPVAVSLIPHGAAVVVLSPVLEGSIEKTFFVSEVNVTSNLKQSPISIVGCLSILSHLSGGGVDQEMRDFSNDVGGRQYDEVIHVFK